jgi:hypothetical protein
MTPAGPERLVSVTRQRAAGIGHHSCPRVQTSTGPARRHAFVGELPDRVSTPTPATPGTSAVTLATAPWGTMMRVSRKTPADSRTQKLRLTAPAPTLTDACGATDGATTGADTISTSTTHRAASQVRAHQQHLHALPLDDRSPSTGWGGRLALEGLSAGRTLGA